MSRRRPVVALVGPTAVGKTELSITLAQGLGAEIVSADSRLVYRGMDIGTAKPSAAQRAAVPHHLIDVVEATADFSLAQYCRLAMAAIGSIHERGKLALVVGGTGQYVTALLEGWRPPPRAKDRSFRRQMESLAREQGVEAVHRRLEAIDPVRARAIDPRNLRRVIRALEIEHVTGKLPSQLRRREPPPFDILWIGLARPRRQLYGRIDARIDEMFDEGLLREVEGLLQAGVPVDSPPMSAIGYRQAAALLAGELSLDQAKEEMRRLSRQFVRRQSNWFKGDDERISWFDAREVRVEDLLELIRSWLTSLPAAEGGSHQ